MNDSPATPPPLTPEQVDELLSADLDGEFDAAAADLGFTPEAARARLNTTPGVAARRDALRAAQSLLATAPELDELQDARLRATALSAATDARVERTNAGRRHRMLYSVAGIAAVLVGAVALVSVLSHSSSSSVSSKAASGSVQAPSTAPAASEHGALAFGTYPNAEALVRDIRAGKRFSATSGIADSAQTKGAASAPIAGATNGNDNRYTLGARAEALAKCSPVARSTAGGTAASSRGTATVGGKPVSIYVVDGSPPVAYIFSSDCKLVLRQALG